jgi:hypothetical protein
MSRGKRKKGKNLKTGEQEGKKKKGQDPKLLVLFLSVISVVCCFLHLLLY